MIEKILFIAAWVFAVIGFLALVLGILLAKDYEGSIEQKLDAYKGFQRNYSPIIRFGLFSFIISVIVLIANYI